MKRVILGSLIISIIWVASFLPLQAKNGPEQDVTIAEQFGLAYAPLQIMKQEKLLEKAMPSLTVQWRQMGNTAVIREAMLAGEVDIGFMAIPPFLIGWDKGMSWKIACGLSESPLGLVTNQARIRSLKDFTPQDRIAVPQPGSVQHILLAMACERDLGDAKKLDNLLVTLAHPDGMNALFAGKEITAHFTAPPYLFNELAKPGIHQILDGREAIGQNFTFVVGATTVAFHNKRPKAYRGFMTALHQVVGLINKNPDQAAAILAPQYGISKTEAIKYLTWPGMKYSTTIRGIEPFADFMLKQGYITQKPSLREIVWTTSKKEYE